MKSNPTINEIRSYSPDIITDQHTIDEMDLIINQNQNAVENLKNTLKNYKHSGKKEIIKN